MKSGNNNGNNGLRTWIEVDRRAIARNLKSFRNIVSGKKPVKIMAVVKSNAYGHGLIDFAKEMEKLRADFLGVDSMTEARALRREGISLPILVLGYTMPELFTEAAFNNVSVTISSLESLKALRKFKSERPLKIHLKADTGMHRQGFLFNDLNKVIKNFQSSIPNIQVEGLYTHFASAKNPSFPSDTKRQIVEFGQWIKALNGIGLMPTLHAAATSAAILFPESHFEMVRIGIGLYGLWPAKEVREYLSGKNMNLEPALEWKSLISEVKNLKAGARLGYDLTEALDRDSKIAIVPIGYWHGYPRALSSIGKVEVEGFPCKVLGRVSMDMLIIDVTRVKSAREGSEVTVIAKNLASPASVEKIAEILDVSWYEIITRLNPLIKRIYV